MQTRLQTLVYIKIEEIVGKPFYAKELREKKQYAVEVHPPQLLLPRVLPTPIAQGAAHCLPYGDKRPSGIKGAGELWPQLDTTIQSEWAGPHTVNLSMFLLH